MSTTSSVWVLDSLWRFWLWDRQGGMTSSDLCLPDAAFYPRGIEPLRQCIDNHHADTVACIRVSMVSKSNDLLFLQRI